MTGMATRELDEIVDGFVGEVRGMDLAQGIDAAQRTFLAAAHRRFPVLLLRGQQLDAEGFKRFGAVFGRFEIDRHVPQYQDGTHREIIYLTNRTGDGAPDAASVQRGAAWHADSTYKAAPCAHTALYALKVPSRGGGTLFADMQRAWETLPAPLRQALEGRRAKHKFSAGPAEGGTLPMSEEQDALHPPVMHPAVRRDPETGRQALYVNPLHTYGLEDMTQAEAAALLHAVFAHGQRPEFVYHHHYRPGDVVIWDQRRTWHKAEAAYAMAEERLLMRLKIAAPDTAAASAA